MSTKAQNRDLFEHRNQLFLNEELFKLTYHKTHVKTNVIMKRKQHALQNVSKKTSNATCIVVPCILQSCPFQRRQSFSYHLSKYFFLKASKHESQIKLSMKISKLQNRQ